MFLLKEDRGVKIDRFPSMHFVSDKYLKYKINNQIIYIKQHKIITNLYLYNINIVQLKKKIIIITSFVKMK